MPKTFLFLTGLNGFLSVAFGAFAAHGLKSRLDEYSMGVFRTGVDYHFYHTLGLGLIAILLTQMPSPWFRATGWLFQFGILVFSGSLYILALSGQKWLGAITPIGGLAFLIGWILLGIGALKGT